MAATATAMGKAAISPAETATSVRGAEIGAGRAAIPVTETATGREPPVIPPATSGTWREESAILAATSATAVGKTEPAVAELASRMAEPAIPVGELAIGRERTARAVEPSSAAYAPVPTSAVASNRGTLRTFVACSKAYASLISVGSLHAGPMKESPTGNPKAWPAGTVMLG